MCKTSRYYSIYLYLVQQNDCGGTVGGEWVEPKQHQTAGRRNGKNGGWKTMGNVRDKRFENGIGHVHS